MKSRVYLLCERVDNLRVENDAQKARVIPARLDVKKINRTIWDLPGSICVRLAFRNGR
jgi:hypothetical protein